MPVQRSEPQSIWQLGGLLLEGPLWVARDAALWFTDIKRHRIYRHDPASGGRSEWQAPAPVGFVLPVAGGGFVAGLKTGLARFDARDGSFVAVCDPEPRHPDNRLNDGTVDPRGRLWFGTMDDGEAESTGCIYRLGADGRCVPESDFCAITNGPALSPDGRTLYHTDTLGGLIHACEVSEEGHLSNRRLFAAIPNEEGYPDGPTVDAEGCVWTGALQGLVRAPLFAGGRTARDSTLPGERGHQDRVRRARADDGLRHHRGEALLARGPGEGAAGRRPVRLRGERARAAGGGDRRRALSPYPSNAAMIGHGPAVPAPHSLASRESDARAASRSAILASSAAMRSRASSRARGRSSVESSASSSAI